MADEATPTPALDSSPGGKGRHGGRRPGAGRPRGSKSVLPRGYVAAVKAMRLRVPPNTPPELAEVADRAFERLVDVMEERVFEKQANAVLSAARAVREEVCGPVKQQHELSGPGGEPLTVVIREFKPETGEE